MHSEIRQYPVKIQNIYHSLIDEVLKTLASYFVEMQRNGILRKFDTELSARAFLGMFFSHFNAENFLMHKKYRHSDTDMVVREFVSIFVQGTRKGRKERDNT
jgi:hypothetical protein